MNFTRRSLDEWLVITAEEPLGRNHVDEFGGADLAPPGDSSAEPDHTARRVGDGDKVGEP